MSNCVDIACDVVIPGDFIDIKRLIQDIENAPDDPRTMPMDVDWVTYYLSWFLKGAIDSEGDALVWHPGDGQSSHTWRDLKGTVKAINEYKIVEDELAFRFWCRDSDAGNDARWGWSTF